MRIAALLLGLLLLLACQDQGTPSSAGPAAPGNPASGLFGDPLPTGVALAVADLLLDPAPHEQQELLITGRVAKVCQASGCWLELEGSPKNLTLVFETAAGQEFTVPKELAGQTISAQGRLERLGGELQLVAHGLAIQR